MRKYLAAVLLAAMTVMLPAPAQAADLHYNYIAYAGGSFVRAVGSTVGSDLTAQSTVSGLAVGDPLTRSNNVAAVNIEKLVNTGAVETTTSWTPFLDGVRITSRAKTLGVSLLNGVIKADAVETITTTTGNAAGTMTSHAATKFVNLRIVNVDLPLTIPENYKVSIPGVATVVLNAYNPGTLNGGTTNQGFGLGLYLLQSQGSAGSGSTVLLNPTYSAMAPSVPVDKPQVGGNAYATRIIANAGPGTTAAASPSALVGTPPGGSGNVVQQNSTASVNINGVINTGAIKSTTKSFTDTNFAEVTNTSELAGVRLFNGLITADAVKASSNSKKQNGVYSSVPGLTILNLKINGQPITANVGPNTTINVANLGWVVINRQVKTENSLQVFGLWIKLTTARAGLPVGAEVHVAQALTFTSK